MPGYCSDILNAISIGCPQPFHDTLDKDPWFTLAANSPDSWIIAKVDGVKNVADAGITIDTVTPAAKVGTWHKVNVAKDEHEKITSVEIIGTPATTIADGYYLYKAAGNNDGKVTTTEQADKDTAPLFNSLTAGSKPTNSGNLNITIKGVAVQATSEMTLENSKVAVMQAAVDKLG